MGPRALPATAGHLGGIHPDRPFDGLTIGTGIHLEAKTVTLLLTLRDGGARLVSTGNLNATQPDAVARRRVDAGSRVVPVPRDIDAAVARGYLDRKYPAAS